MKGHIRERSPGHWAIVIELRDETTGKRKRKWHSFRGTKREAQIERARLIASVGEGTYVERSKKTVAEFVRLASIYGRPRGIFRPGRRSAIDSWSKIRLCRTWAPKHCRS